MSAALTASPTSALTEDQRSIQEMAQRFSRERLAPGFMAREREGRIDRALVREIRGRR